MGMLMRRNRLKKEQELKQEVEVKEVEQEFACPYCDKVYKTEKGLNAHIESKHQAGDE